MAIGVGCCGVDHDDETVGYGGQEAWRTMDLVKEEQLKAFTSKFGWLMKEYLDTLVYCTGDGHSVDIELDVLNMEFRITSPGK